VGFPVLPPLHSHSPKKNFFCEESFLKKNVSLRTNTIKFYFERKFSIKENPKPKIVKPSMPAMRQNAQIKYYAFTSFETEDPPYDPNIMSYLIAGREICPNEGTPHWQCYKFFCFLLQLIFFFSVRET
jgi:hypothetical protein